ncbi:MAG: hypothetical protein ACI85K_002518, partial [Hyphomicrobiaceae bacterium]
MHTTTRICFSLVAGSLLAYSGLAQQQPAGTTRATRPVASFAFDGNSENAAGTSVAGTNLGAATYVRGLEGRALRLRSSDSAATFTIRGAGLAADPSKDFSV